MLLARGTTWANVDGALRLLAEDPAQEIVFGPWTGGTATELLYWVPFVRWAQEHFALDPARVTVVARSGTSHWYGDAGGRSAETLEAARSASPGAAVFPAEPVADLVEEYRRGAAPPRPLLKRARHALLTPPAGRAAARPPAGYVAIGARPLGGVSRPRSGTGRRPRRWPRRLAAGRHVVTLDGTDDPAERHRLLAGAGGLVAAYSGIALLGALSGIPVIALRSADGVVAEPDVDLAFRLVSQLGGSLTVLDAERPARAPGGAPQRAGSARRAGTVSRSR